MWRAAVALISFLGFACAELTQSESEGRHDVPALFRCSPESVATYRLNYSSWSRSDPGALLGAGEESASPLSGATDFYSRVESDFTITALEAHPSGCSVLFRFDVPEVILEVNGQPVPSQASAIRDGLSKPVFGLTDPNGKILEIRLDPALSHLARSYAQTLLSLTQFVAGTPPKWESREEDPNGAYIAEYDRVEPEIRRYRKIKRRYLQLDPENDAAITPSGVLFAEFGPDDLLEKLEGREAQKIEIGGRALAQSENELLVVERSRTRISGSALRALRAARTEVAANVEAIPLSARGWEEEAARMRHRKTLGGATAEDLLAQLRALESAPDPDTEIDLSRKINALISLEPDAATQFADFLLRSAASSPVMTVVSSALSSSGTPQAQAVLAAAIRARSKEPDAVFRLIFALAMAGPPTVEAEQVVRDLALGGSEPAQLALGIMARSLAKDSPQRAEAIVTSLIEKLQSDRSERGLIHLLLVLGNSGSPLSLPIIREALGHDSAGVRKAAVLALRFIPDPEIETLLKTVSQSDADADVRVEAARVLSDRQ